MNVNGTRLWDTLILPTYITSKNCELLGDMSGILRFVLLLLADEYAERVRLLVLSF